MTTISELQNQISLYKTLMDDCKNKVEIYRVKIEQSEQLLAQLTE